MYFCNSTLVSLITWLVLSSNMVYIMLFYILCATHKLHGICYVSLYLLWDMLLRFGQLSKSLVLVVQFSKHATPVVLARKFTKKYWLRLIVVKQSLCRVYHKCLGWTSVSLFQTYVAKLSAKYPYHKALTPWIMDDRNFMNNNNLFD